jgi:putative membrane protein
MIFGPKRFHPVYMFENFFKDFALLLIALGVAIFRGDMTIFTSNWGVIIACVYGPLRRLIIYFNTRISVDESRLFIDSGWFFKKHEELPLSSIATVDLRQSPLHQVFGAYRLNVDNAGSIADAGNGVTMTFGSSDAMILKNLLKPDAAAVNGVNLAADKDRAGGPSQAENVREYHAGTFELIAIGALKSKLAFTIQLIVVVCGGFQAMQQYLSLDDKKIGHTFGSAFADLGLTITIVVVTAVFLLLAVICGAIGSLIRYYDFRVVDDGEKIRINYGLITKQTFTIHKSRISGFAYEQSFIMRRLHIGTLKCYAVGYGNKASDDEVEEEPLMIPLLKENRLRETIGMMLPELAPEMEYEHPQRRSWYYFLYSFSVYFAVACMAACIYITAVFDLNVMIIGAVVMALALMGVLMQYCNTAICADGDQVDIAFGGYKKTTVIVKLSSVEWATGTTSYFKNKKHVMHITMGFLAPSGHNEATAKNVSSQALDVLNGLLDT